MTKGTLRKSLKMTIRAGLVGALLAICFLPGIGPQGSINKGEAKAFTASTDTNVIAVPELPVILVPALLLIAGRMGAAARKRAARV
jgi:hypothetical protein